MRQSRSTEWDRPELLRHLEAARGLARRLMRDASEAEDVSQDAAALALTKAEGQAQGPWIYGAVRNLVMQRDRQAARRKRREREAARSERAADHGEMLAAVESHRRLVDHVLALDERDRDVLLRRYFHGQTPAQMAAKKGRTIAAISNQLTRAHRSLQRRLEADGGRGHWMSGLAPLAAWGGAAPKTSPWVLGAWLLSSGAIKAATAGAVALLCAALYWLVPAGQGGPLPGQTVNPPTSAPGPNEIAQHRDGTHDGPRTSVNPAKPSGGRVAAAGPEVIAPVPTTLTGQVQEARGLPLAAPRVTLRAPDGTTHAPAPNAGASPSWANVPHGLSLDVMIEVDGTPWPTPIAKIELDEGSNETVAWTVHTRTIVRGIAVDEHGAPLAGQLVNLHRAWRPEASFAGVLEESSDMGTTLTDGAGRFLFPPMLPGAYQLMGRTQSSWVTKHEENADGEIEVTEADGRVTSKVPCSSWTQPLAIPFNAPSVEPSLVLYTGGVIRGQVVSEISGDPVSGKAIVQIDSLSSLGYTHGETNSDGVFTSPPLPPGRFKLQVPGSPGGWMPGSPLEASAGDSAVNLLVLPAATVEVRIDTGPASLSGKGWLRAKAIRPKTMQHQPGIWIDPANLTGNFDTLPPGAYSFFFTSKDGVLAGLIARTDLGPGELPGGLVLKAAATGTIQVHAAEEELFVTASVQGVEFDICRVRPGQTDKMHVPAGPVTLRITRGDNKTATERSIVLGAGEVHPLK